MGQRRAEKDEKNTKKEFPNKETPKEGQGLPLWNYGYTNRYPLTVLIYMQSCPEAGLVKGLC